MRWIAFLLAVGLTVACAGSGAPPPAASAPASASASAELRRLLAQGQRQGKAGDLDGALASFRRAERLAPGNPAVNYFLGTTLLRLEDPERAIPYLKQAVELDPRNPNRWIALNQLAYSYRHLGEEEQAIDYFVEALRVNPNNKDAMVHLADLHFQREEFPLCREYVELFKARVAAEDPSLLTEQDRQRTRVTLDRMAVYTAEMQRAGSSD